MNYALHALKKKKKESLVLRNFFFAQLISFLLDEEREREKGGEDISKSVERAWKLCRK